ncbi:type VI secretion system protein TssA [Archangium lansingense]|uniref:Type VI secretion system protein TssA n=1 Tax=Archangium lansingense TaxID=2995310 RepID=A0ABT4AEB5_9BACT|nr:type VI secretion system protein TssA [Archangium lansinium]MCY1080022.1 type VI secretion system protein TssA [Archangium lansinium]
MADATPVSPPDLEPLLQPISPEAPSGRSLRYEPLYQQIREARREDDASLPQGVWQAPLKRADWALVGELCQQALTRESKDLQLSVWLTEAWLMQRGFAGLPWGLRLSTALLERFWDTLWPILDGDDAEARLAPLKWLDDRLVLALGRVPLVRPPVPGAVTYVYADWQQLLLRERQAGTRARTDTEEDETPGGTTPPPVTRERFIAAAAQMSAPTLAALSKQLTEALASASALEHVLDAQLGDSSVALRRSRALLGDIQTLLTLLRGGSSTEQPEEEPEAEPEPVDTPDERTTDELEALSELSEPEQLTDIIQGRTEAYQLLGLAADYLLRTEPHSPVPYLVKRALAWGRMPLHELLRELVPDDSNVQAIHTLLGMNQER